MKFTKMHGLGNDYLYVYGEVPENIAELSGKLSERLKIRCLLANEGINIQGSQEG